MILAIFLKLLRNRRVNEGKSKKERANAESFCRSGWLRRSWKRAVRADDSGLNGSAGAWNATTRLWLTP